MLAAGDAVRSRFTEQTSRFEASSVIITGAGAVRFQNGVEAAAIKPVAFFVGHWFKRNGNFVRFRRRTADLVDKQSAGAQRVVANHLGGQSIAWRSRKPIIFLDRSASTRRGPLDWAAWNVADRRMTVTICLISRLTSQPFVAKSLASQSSNFG